MNGCPRGLAAPSGEGTWAKGTWGCRGLVRRAADLGNSRGRRSSGFYLGPGETTSPSSGKEKRHRKSQRAKVRAERLRDRCVAHASVIIAEHKGRHPLDKGYTFRYEPRSAGIGKTTRVSFLLFGLGI